MMRPSENPDRRSTRPTPLPSPQCLLDTALPAPDPDSPPAATPRSLPAAIPARGSRESRSARRGLPKARPTGAPKEDSGSPSFNPLHVFPPSSDRNTPAEVAAVSSFGIARRNRQVPRTAITDDRTALRTGTLSQLASAVLRLIDEGAEAHTGGTLPVEPLEPRITGSGRRIPSADRSPPREQRRRRLSTSRSRWFQTS